VLEETRIGFIGVGAMGEPMARALRRAAFPVTACAHRNRAPLERLRSDGVREANDPSEVAAKSDVIILCVPDAPHVYEVLFGQHGAARAAQASAVFVDMSTISPVATREHARLLSELGHRFLDAPVSGGPARAAEGSLAIMVGGTAKDFARVESVLRVLGTPTLVGPVGMGETVKLVNQVMIASIMLANVEALIFARRSGADLDVVRNVIATATGANYLLENWLPKTWFAGTFEGGFSLDLLRKDLNAALESWSSVDPRPGLPQAWQANGCA